MLDATDEHALALQDALAGVYSFERELGRGGMGTVYLAREVALDRLVAIKVLHPALAEQPEARARFLREARTGARLAHPNIVPIYAVGEAAGTVYFVMAYVDGESVRTRLHRDGPIAPEEVARLLRDVGSGLAHAHAVGVLHRDVSLDNILVERGTDRALLADFGIAAEIDAAGTSALIGTPAYLAPELIQGEPPSPRSDLYALGIAAWAMLTGRLPFPDADPAQVLLQQVTAPIPPLRDAAAGTPRRIRDAVERALCKDPADRPADVEEWLRGLDAHQAPPTLALPLQRWVHRWSGIRVFYAMGASIVAMLSIAMGHPSLGTGGVLQALIALLAQGFLLLPIVLLIHGAINWRLLRGLARAGYGIEDLRLAQVQHREAQQRQRRQPVSTASRIVLDLTLIALGLWILANILVTGAGRHGYLLATFEMYRFWLGILRWGHVVFWSGLGLLVLSPPFRASGRGWLSRQVDRFWSSIRGAAVFQAASLFLPRGRAAAHTLHRPTELVLDLAIEDLWEALPRGERRRMREVPEVARGLRRRAGEVRAVLHHLEQSPVRGSDETEELRARLQLRERGAIDALERLRVGLLELSGHATSPRDFSRILDQAATLQAELLTELGADRTVVARLVTQRPHRTGSPSMPTPSAA